MEPSGSNPQTKGDFDATTTDGVLAPGLTLSVQSYIGEPGGPEGVKLKEEVVVIETRKYILIFASGDRLGRLPHRLTP